MSDKTDETGDTSHTEDTSEARAILDLTGPLEVGVVQEFLVDPAKAE